VSEAPPPARAITRFIVGVAVAAVAGTATFLIMVQGSFHKGYTDLDFNHTLGTAVKGTTLRETEARAALGLVGDTAGPIGLYAGLVGAGVLIAVYGLVIRRVHRHWVLTGLGLGVVTFLVIGLVYPPIADARQDEFPVGLFGVDAGGFTAVVLGLSALGFGLVAARCFDLITSAHWWEPAEAVHDEVAAVTGVDEHGSLELPEEGAEQGGMRA
jgi:hypothetical protein